VNVIALRTLRDFWRKHNQAEKNLRVWNKKMRAGQYNSVQEVQANFSDAEYVDGLMIFNIGGNKYRLVVAMDFARQRCYIKYVFTHPEYDSWSKA